MTRTRTASLLFAAAALALGACKGGSSSTTPVGNQNGPAAGAGSIRSIDWQNRTYASEEGTYTVKDGTFEFAYDENGNPVPPDSEPTGDGYIERGSFGVAAPIFGDLDGDGAEEAVILSFFDGGGTGKFTGIEVYTMRAGREQVLGIIPGGDRGDGGIDDVRLDGAVVLVDRLMSVEGDGACCPSKIAHERWRWSGSAFAEDEAARVVEDFGEEHPY